MVESFICGFFAFASFTLWFIILASLMMHLFKGVIKEYNETEFQLWFLCICNSRSLVHYFCFTNDAFVQGYCKK